MKKIVSGFFPKSSERGELIVKSTLGIATIALTASLPGTAQAADPPRDRTIEEVIVTATRRAESLQDVPVSVGVVSGEEIRQLSLQNLDQLSAYVPGLNVVEGGEQTGISIRGFGSGINFGFDQSVGLFIDGIYAGRERQFRARFLDIESVEVLRGPQNTLFGKNTISGAIILRTARPSQENSLDLRAEHTPRTDGQQYEAVFNGGLTDTLSGRLAMRYFENDGYMDNTLTGEEEEQEEDWVARASFLWEPVESLSIFTKFERSEYERVGRHYNVSQVSGQAVGRPLVNDGDVAAAAALPTYLSYDPDFEFDDLSQTSKQRETADVEATNIVLQADWETGAGTLTSITGYSAYESEDQRDVDWTPTNFLFEPISQDFDQYSQEIQFVSETYDKYDYIVGVHGYTNDFFVDRRTDINIEPFLIPFGVEPFSETIFGGPASAWRYAQLRFLDEETDSVSIYGQFNYNITPALTLSAGLRWNREKQTADDRYFLSEFGNDRFLELDETVVSLLDSFAPAADVIAAATAAGGDNLIIANVCQVLCGNVAGIASGGRIGGGELVEKDWSPELTLSWDAADNAMFYGKFTRGHKAGGFNSQTVGQEAPDETFEDETVTGYELGGKLTLLDGTARLNFSAFRMDFDDLQVSVWVGDGFDVGNAAEARSQGLEMDGNWLLGERLQLNGSFIWLDARYQSFPGAACSIPQRNFPSPEPGCVENPPGTFLQDLSGKRFAPTFSGNVGIGYVQPIGSGLELLLRADAVYWGDQENPRDPTIEQDSRTMVDLGATLRSVDLRWDVGLLVQNATDEDFYWYEFEAPAQIGTRIGFPGPPRRVTLRASYHL